MRRRIPVHLFTTLFLLALAACSSPAPTPTPEATRRPTRTPNPTFTPQPTATETPLATETTEPTATEVPTEGEATPKPGASNVPAANVGNTGLTNNVWFTAPLIQYFSQAGAFPPEPIIERPANINPLTGLEVSDPALLQRRPIIARLGNDPNARGIHTGFNQADLVFEELIDQRASVFALTRFSLVFLGQNATFRPLRSIRAVNASLEPMLQATLVDSGGSKGTRFMVSQLPWSKLNLDGDLNGIIICTIGEGYTSHFASTVQHIHDYLTAKGLEQPVPLRGFQFSPDAPTGDAVTSIAFDHSPWPYKTTGVAEWKYDAGSGRYLRFVNGAPHNTLEYDLTPNWGRVCAAQGEQKSEQISAANVVVLNARYDPTEIIEDTNNFASAFIELTGEGDAQIYRDGVRIKAKWQRPTLQHFFKFLDANGNEIPLKPGNTWFELAPLGYAPTTH